MIRQLEVVSSHFSYQEEYVWSKSIAWLNRKYEQVQREKHEAYAQNANSITSGVYGAIVKALDSDNKIDFADLLVKDYDEAIKQQKVQLKEDAQDSGGGKYKMSFIEKARAAQMKQG